MQKDISEIFVNLCESEIKWRQTKSPIDEMRVAFHCKRLRSLVLPIVDNLLRSINRNNQNDKHITSLMRTKLALNSTNDTNKMLIKLHQLISMFHGTNEFGKKMMKFSEVSSLLYH